MIDSAFFLFQSQTLVSVSKVKIPQRCKKSKSNCGIVKIEDEDEQSDAVRKRWSLLPLSRSTLRLSAQRHRLPAEQSATLPRAVSLHKPSRASAAASASTSSESSERIGDGEREQVVAGLRAHARVVKVTPRCTRTAMRVCGQSTHADFV